MTVGSSSVDHIPSSGVSLGECDRSRRRTGSLCRIASLYPPTPGSRPHLVKCPPAWVPTGQKGNLCDRIVNRRVHPAITAAPPNRVRHCRSRDLYWPITRAFHVYVCIAWNMSPLANHTSSPAIALYGFRPRCTGAWAANGSFEIPRSLAVPSSAGKPTALRLRSRTRLGILAWPGANRFQGSTSAAFVRTGTSCLRSGSGRVICTVPAGSPPRLVSPALAGRLKTGDHHSRTRRGSSRQQFLSDLC